MSEVHTHEVGQPYHPERTRWDEAIQYNYRLSQHELVGFLRRPTTPEIASWTEEEWQFGLFIRPGVLFLLFKPGSMPWSDAPYSYQRVQELAPAEATPPFALPTPESRALLTVILVDASTGIVEGLRVTTFSPKFSRALHAAIQEQIERPVSLEQSDREIARTYQLYTVNQMVRICDARCRGGE